MAGCFKVFARVALLSQLEVINMRNRAIYLLPIILMPSYAYAYLDPGTGSIILQAIVAGLVSVAVAFSSLRIKIKAFLRSLFRGKSKGYKDTDE